MKKIYVLVILVSMLCISITGAGISINPNKVYNHIPVVDLNYGDHLSTEELTYVVSNRVNQYINADIQNYQPIKETAEPVQLPWRDISNADILEWWIQLEYNGQIFDAQVDVSLTDFSDKFLKHPEYGEILFFNMDSDPADDVEVIVGFYWSTIKYPDGDDARSLELRYRIRQMPGGGLADQDGELEVWSQIRVNYGLISLPGKSKSTPVTLQERFRNILQNIFEKNKKPRFPVINNLLEKILYRNTEDNNKFIGTLDNSDSDYIAMGSGYRSAAGEQIPLLVEKRFSFAKSFNWNWRNEGSLFNPTILEHELYEVTSSDPVEVLYGFQAYDANDVKQFDVAFNVEFSPPVYVRTKWIPANGYVYYYWDHKSQRNTATEIAFTADVFLGSAISVPKLVLTLDKIDNNLGRSNSWFSFDLEGLKGFKYKASNSFNVGITVDVPTVFEEKIEIKGLPTSVEAEWGFENTDFLITPNRYNVGIDVYSQVTMDDDIDRITVFYPKFDDNQPDTPLLEINSIPSSQRISAGGDISLSRGGVLDVSLSGHAGLTMSGSVGDVTVYYPKADWVNDPDEKFITIPQGIPSSISASALGRLYVDLDNIMDSSNYVYGSVSHTMSSNFEEINIFIPTGIDPNLVDPLVRFTDIPSQTNSWGQLFWGQLKGEFHIQRGSIGGFDPLEISLGYGDYEVYDKLEIRDGSLDTRFHIANDGYIYLDSTQSMLGNIMIFEDNANNHYLEFTISEVSAENLNLHWDVSNDGNNLKVNDLGFSGIINTLKSFQIDLRYLGRSAQMDLDWQLGTEGGIEIDVYQDDPVTLDFDLDDNIEGLKLHGHVTLPSDPHFDCAWKWRKGDSPYDPGFFRINYNTNEIAISDLYLYLTYNNLWGAEASLSNVGIYFYSRWYWVNLLPYIWSEFAITGDIDVNLLLDGEWYYNVEDLIVPP